MAYIALGSNLSLQRSTPAEIVSAAIDALGALGRVRARSGLWRSEAWPSSADPPFVNAVVSLETSETPEMLLAALHRIESSFGRRRDQGPNAPRTLDLDLLDFEGATRPNGLATPSSLVLPHPRMMTRSFVLAPLIDVAPLWRHPQTGESATEGLARLGPEGLRSIHRRDPVQG